MITTNPFEMARESILPSWSQTMQAQHSAHNACAPELFIFSL
jgi:hypothetical protein